MNLTSTIVKVVSTTKYAAVALPMIHSVIEQTKAVLVTTYKSSKKEVSEIIIPNLIS